MTITADELLAIMPNAKNRIAAFLSPLNDAMAEFDISPSPLRMAAFLAQVAHESGELRWEEELASGKEYEGRKDLGNIHPGDGVKFKGRGLIQVTGEFNYQACSRALFGDDRLLETPQLLDEPAGACRSAGWFWKTHNLNQLADQQDMRGITRRINGGYNGMDQRLAYYKRALDVFKAEVA